MIEQRVENPDHDRKRRDDQQFSGDIAGRYLRQPHDQGERQGERQHGGNFVFVKRDHTNHKERGCDNFDPGVESVDTGGAPGQSIEVAQIKKG